MTMPIAGLFNLGLWMFPTWPACGHTCHRFSELSRFEHFHDFNKGYQTFQRFSTSKRVLKLLGSPRNAPKPALECPTSFVPKGTQANLVRLMPKATKTTKKHRFLSGSKHFPLILFRLTYDIMDFGPSTCEPTNRWKLDEKNQRPILRLFASFDPHAFTLTRRSQKLVKTSNELGLSAFCPKTLFHTQLGAPSLKRKTKMTTFSCMGKLFPHAIGTLAIMVLNALEGVKMC